MRMWVLGPGTYLGLLPLEPSLLEKRARELPDTLAVDVVLATLLVFVVAFLLRDLLLRPLLLDLLRLRRMKQVMPTTKRAPKLRPMRHSTMSEVAMENDFQLDLVLGEEQEEDPLTGYITATADKVVERHRSE